MLSNNGLCYAACTVLVTICSTGSKFCPISNFATLHALTIASRSYVLLTWTYVPAWKRNQSVSHKDSPPSEYLYTYKECVGTNLRNEFFQRKNTILQESGIHELQLVKKINKVTTVLLHTCCTSTVILSKHTYRIIIQQCKYVAIFTLVLMQVYSFPGLHCLQS